MFLKKDEIKRLCTSELVYHLTFPNDKNLDINSIENRLYEKLKSQYKLDVDTSKKFIELEQSKIIDRGQGLNKFLFGEAKTIEEALKLFYTNEKQFGIVVPLNGHFQDFTFSELALFGALFQSLVSKYEKRNEKILLMGKLELDETKSKILLNQAKKEKSLISYYELLFQCMRIKMTEMLEYKNIPDYKQTLLITKELLFLMKQCENFAKDSKKLDDFEYNAYEYERKIIEDNKVNTYIFNK